MREITSDWALNGAIQVKQRRTGYRFSIDALLLAGCLRPDLSSGVLDLGTGCGIIPLVLARRHSGLRICGVEIQRDLARIARENVLANGMDDQVKILEMDMRQLKKSDLPFSVNLVVSNPPYRRRHSGRINPDSQKAIARHEIKVTLPELVDAGARILDPGGKFAVIYPAERLLDLLGCMRQRVLEPKRLRMVQSAPGEEAKRVLVEGKKLGRPGLRVSPPLTVYRADGSYSDEVAAMLRPPSAPPEGGVLSGC
jgi:tRNA1Val (adenine37-N6)-methyltransferase